MKIVRLVTPARLDHLNCLSQRLSETSEEEMFDAHKSPLPFRTDSNALFGIHNVTMHIETMLSIHDLYFDCITQRTNDQRTFILHFI